MSKAVAARRACAASSAPRTSARIFFPILSERRDRLWKGVQDGCALCNEQCSFVSGTTYRSAVENPTAPSLGDTGSRGTSSRHGPRPRRHPRGSGHPTSRCVRGLSRLLLPGLHDHHLAHAGVTVPERGVPPRRGRPRDRPGDAPDHRTSVPRAHRRLVHPDQGRRLRLGGLIRTSAGPQRPGSRSHRLGGLRRTARRSRATRSSSVSVSSALGRPRRRADGAAAVVFTCSCRIFAPNFGRRTLATCNSDRGVTPARWAARTRTPPRPLGRFAGQAPFGPRFGPPGRDEPPSRGLSRPRGCGRPRPTPSPGSRCRLALASGAAGWWS